MAENEYNPLQWPPDITLAQLHFDCCKPGIDNTEGRRCPCCNRYQKLGNSKWPIRDIVKDFRNYGGGIPGYFHLLIYLMVVLVILCGVVVVYHIILLNQVCPTLAGTHARCGKVFGVFYFIDGNLLYENLVNTGNENQANALMGIQLATYIILVLATIGIKIILHVLNRGSNLDGKLFSRFSLIIKNVPLYYQLQDLKRELKVIDPAVQISQLFYVYKTCECQRSFKAVCDLYFRLKQAEQNLQMDNRQKFQKEYRKMKSDYLQHFDRYEKELQNLKASSKKVVVCFNTIEQKEKIHKALRMNEFMKTLHYVSKMFGCKSESIGYYTERIAEPQEVYWKYIGESSTKKLRVRIGTTFLGIGLIIIAFCILYVPMIKIDIDRIESPSVGNGLNFLISFIVFLLMIVYRVVVGRLLSTRRPSSKLAENYFIVVTCTIFNFFFYLIVPACFYIFTTEIPYNFKLAELFMTCFSFCIFGLFLNWLDIGYLGFNGKKKRLLNKMTQAKAFCQSRLHEEVTPPPFPVASKIVMVFNVWTFNSFYIFNIPYLLLFFLAVFFILFWIDKFILYNRYKMQSYLSVELEHKSQKFYLVIFLICVSLGYLTITQFEWQRWLVLVVFVVALVINFSLQFSFKKEKDEEANKANTDLKGAIERCKTDAIASNTLNIMEQEMKNSLFLNNPKDYAVEVSQASLATAILMYGYQQTYNLYLSQFSKKQIHTMLENKCFDIKKAVSTFSKPGKRRESELAELVDQSLQQKLISRGNMAKQAVQSSTPKFYQPPKVDSVRFYESVQSNNSKNPQHSRQQQKQPPKEDKKPQQQHKQQKSEQQHKQQVKKQHEEQQQVKQGETLVRQVLEGHPKQEEQPQQQISE